MSADRDVETCRLDTLAELDILDTPREIAFDRIAGLCRKIFDVPMSTLTFLDGHRQWFKASEGIEARETDRQPALCNYAIQQATPLIVPDTLLDPRFANNPFVVGAPFIRFYAGAQLTVSGANIGTLCAVDTRPREFTARDVGMLKDLAAITVDELQLRNLSMRDSLTGALSRRAFRDEGERLHALAQRYGHQLTCAILDVDHFKSVNDRFGHAIGDAVLSGVVETCRATLRYSDLLGRLGGEEFGILMPHTNLHDGMAVVEKMRAAIAERAIETPVGPVHVTCSFGVIESSPGLSFDDMLHRADLAMYSAKTGGRNQAIAWVEPAPSISPVSRRVFKAGKITFNSGRSSFDCTVRALSESAATLEVMSVAEVPEQFKLAIASDGFSRACRLTAKAGKRVDIAFL